jgi:hypothetical protein
MLSPAVDARPQRPCEHRNPHSGKMARLMKGRSEADKLEKLVITANAGWLHPIGCALASSTA